jgi:hypothetical protein
VVRIEAAGAEREECAKRMRRVQVMHHFATGFFKMGRVVHAARWIAT